MTALAGEGARAVRVSASTSNLGTGFDCLGLALDLFLDVRAEPAPDAPSHRVEGPPVWPATTDDRLLAAFDRASEALGLPACPHDFRVATEIPLARGLGSSGAATAAGILLAASRAASPPDPERLLALGVELEGHPDNVAASLAGGATLSFPVAGGARSLPVEVHDDLAFAVAWPELTVETERARAVLPQEVPFADAVENARRLPVLLEGLRRADPELLRIGGEDRLHERHRLPLVPGATAALDAAREAGAWLAVLSGSGSALLAISGQGDAERIASSIADTFRRETGAGTGRALRLVREAPRVREVS